jgi:hypothetical protein
MDDLSRPAWQQLLETGILVQFRILDAHTESALDKENVAVRADLIFIGDDADTASSEVSDIRHERPVSWFRPTSTTIWKDVSVVSSRSLKLTVPTSTGLPSAVRS